MTNLRNVSWFLRKSIVSNDFKFLSEFVCSDLNLQPSSKSIRKCGNGGNWSATSAVNGLLLSTTSLSLSLPLNISLGKLERSLSAKSTSMSILSSRNASACIDLSCVARKFNLCKLSSPMLAKTSCGRFLRGLSWRSRTCMSEESAGGRRRSLEAQLAVFLPDDHLQRQVEMWAQSSQSLAVLAAHVVSITIQYHRAHAVRILISLRLRAYIGGEPGTRKKHFYCLERAINSEVEESKRVDKVCYGTRKALYHLATDLFSFYKTYMWIVKFCFLHPYSGIE